MRQLLVCILILTVCRISAQVSQVPQVYYNNNDVNLFIRPSASLSSMPISTISLSPSGKIVAESIVTSTETQGKATWVRVCLPTTTGTIAYGYMLYGERYIRINETNNYATTTANVNVRSGAGTSFPNVTISGTPVTYGSGSVVALTGTSSNVNGTIWHQVYLPNGYSQLTGYISQAFLSLPVLENYYVVGGNVQNSSSILIWGATVNIGSWNTNSTEGFYQYKVPKLWNGSITCIHPNYTSSIPNSYIYTANSSNYSRNFVMNGSTPCTSPVASVNNPTGQNSVEMFCTVTGGSGGTLRYKWYSGLSCSGSVLGTNEILNVSVSGNYSCKAYIDGYESSCFDCKTGQATINNSNYSISGTVVNPSISELSGNILNTLFNCNVKLYISGSNTEVGSTFSSNGSFSFTNLQNQEYDVVASYTSSESIFYSVKALQVSPNTSDLELKLPGNLIEEILDYNSKLTNHVCYLEDLGYNIPVEPYDISSSNSYVISQKNIPDNQSRSIESLERLCIAERVIVKYFDQASLMNNEYAQSINEFAKFVLSLKKLAQCGSLLDALSDFYIDQLKFAFEIPVNNINTPYENSIRVTLDGITDYIGYKVTSSPSISSETLLDLLKDPINRFLTDQMLNNIYIKNTANTVPSSVSRSANEQYSGNILNSISNISQQLAASNVKTSIAQSYAESYRNNPDWTQVLTDAANMAFRASCGRNVYINLLALGLDVINIGFLSASIHKSSKRISELVSECNTVTTVSFSRPMPHFSNRNIRPNSPLHTTSIVSELENEYTASLTDINNNNTGSFNRHFKELNRLNNKLSDSLYEELNKVKAALPFSNISDSSFVSSLKHTMFGAPFVRFAHISALAFYFENPDDVLKDSINFYASEFYQANALMLDELNTIEILLSSVTSSGYINVSGMMFPKVLRPSMDTTITVTLKNYGDLTATSIYCKLKFDNLISAPTDSFYLGSINSGDTGSFSLQIHTSNYADTLSFYSLNIFSENAITIHKGGGISISNILPTEVYRFVGDGNWSDVDNWLSQKIPPMVLFKGNKIVIDPINSGNCTLDIPRIIPPNVELIVSKNKRFTINGDLTIQGDTNNLTDGLVAWYTFAGNAVDSSGYGNNGTVQGATLTADRFGRLNNAYDFNGTTDYIQIPHSESLNFGITNTFSFWIKTSSLTLSKEYYFFAKHTPNSGPPAGISGIHGCVSNLVTSQPTTFFRYDRSTWGNPWGGISLANTPSYDTWTNVVIVTGEVADSIYINGALSYSEPKATTTVIGSNTWPMYFGKNVVGWANNDWGFIGQMDDIRIYNRVLSSAEINALYHEGGY